MVPQMYDETPNCLTTGTKSAISVLASVTIIVKKSISRPDNTIFLVGNYTFCGYFRPKMMDIKSGGYIVSM